MGSLMLSEKKRVIQLHISTYIIKHFFIIWDTVFYTVITTTWDAAATVFVKVFKC